MNIKNIFYTCLGAMLCLGGIAMPAFAQKNYPIIQYGAKPGLRVNNTMAIQKAINAAAITGGSVTIPNGIFVTGPLVLKSGVELHLANDALLLGSDKRMDYEGNMSLISARDQHDIAITGKGIIDGRGSDLVQDALLMLRQGKVTDDEWLLKRPTEKNRPNLVYFLNCKNVTVSGITLKNAASWVQNYKRCTNVQISDMKVQSTAYWNNDGIDIVDSKKVIIRNSYFNAADDAICLKSESVDGVCEDVLVEHCTARSSASGFKIGTGSIGGFRNIRVNNLTVFDTYRSAIALETVDGAFMEDIGVNNVRATNTGNAIFIRLGHRNKDGRYSTVKNVLINDVIADIPSGKPDIGYPMEGPPPKVPPHNLLPSSIVGIPGHPVQNVTLSNIQITYGGGASKAKAYISTDSLATVMENVAGYPEFTMFGELPAWGMYIRHAEGISLNNIKLSYRQSDFRPALVADDVNGASLNGLTIAASEPKETVIFNHVSKPVISDLHLPDKATLTIKDK